MQERWVYCFVNWLKPKACWNVGDRLRVWEWKVQSQSRKLKYKFAPAFARHRLLVKIHIFLLLKIQIFALDLDENLLCFVLEIQSCSKLRMELFFGDSKLSNGINVSKCATNVYNMFIIFYIILVVWIETKERASVRDHVLKSIPFATGIP